MFSMISNLWKSRSCTKGYQRFEAKRVVVRSVTVARIYIAQKGEKIALAEVVGLESEMEEERHPQEFRGRITKI